MVPARRRLALADSRPLPTAGGLIVARACIDPAGVSVGGDLLLPEGRLGLEVVHQELGGVKRRLAMPRGGDHQHDVVARLEGADAVHDQARLQRPACMRLRLDALKFALGHARIVLEHHAGNGFARIVGAHEPREGDDGADIAAAGRQPGDLGADLEVGGLDAHAQGQPPVTGGKKAISEAPAMLALGGACVRSTAARITSERRNASAYSGPCCFSQAINSATVFMFAGSSTCSSALPVFSRTQAKYKSFIRIGVPAGPSSSRSRCAPRPSGSQSRSTTSATPPPTASPTPPR